MTGTSRKAKKILSWFTQPKIWMLVASLLILLPLIFYAYLGTFSRLQADDYCYAWNATSRSLFNSQTTWYRTDSSRFSATFIISISELMGQSMIMLLPALAIGLWLWGTYALFTRIQKMVQLFLPPAAVFLLAEVLVIFILMLTPNRYQVLYWRAGLVIYLYPLIFVTWLLNLLLKLITNPGSKNNILYAALILILFYLNGGFSETIAVVLVGMLSLAWVLMYFFAKKDWRKKALLLVGFALLGALLALATLYFSPATRMRQDLIGPPPDLVSLVRMSMANAFIYLYITLGEQAFTLVILVLISLLVGYQVFSGRSTDKTYKPSNLVTIIFLAPVVAYLWVVCVTAPFAFGESSYPEGRVLLNATLPFVLLLIVEGFTLGISLGLLHQHSADLPAASLRILLLLFMLGLCLYPLYSAREVYAVDYPAYKQRAADWDERDAYIRTQLAQGKKDITITTFFMIGNVLEFHPDSNNWLNNCAAMYYGADSISSVSP